MQQITSERLPDFIHKIATKITGSFSPEKIILFGSYAYGTATADSDVNLLIITDTNARSAERQRMISRLFYPRPISMDIVVKTPAEIKRAQKRVDPFINEILKKGVVLYARS